MAGTVIGPGAGPLLAVAAAAVAVGLAIRSDSVPLSPLVVVAAAPWTVAAAVAVVAGRAGVYEGLSPAPTQTVLVAAVVAVATVTWLGTAHMAALRGVRYRERYLSATGLAAATVLLTALVGRTGGGAVDRLLWIPVALTTAGLLAAAGYFLLGLVYTDALVEFRAVGLFATGAVVFDGVASAVATSILGSGETGVVTTAVVGAMGAGGVWPPAWLLFPAYVLVAAAVVGACAVVTRYRRELGSGCALAVSSLALWSGTVVLLTAALLG